MILVQSWVVSRSGQSLEGALVSLTDQVVVPQGRVSPLIVRRTDGKVLGGLKGGGGSFICTTSDDKIFHGPGNKTGWISSSTLDFKAKPKTYKSSKAAIVTDKWMYRLSGSAIVKT